MRGYGTLQTMTALEVLVDEMCAALPLDPIEFRRRNALKTGERILTGNTHSVSIRTPEILDKLEQHAIWRERAAEKARGREAGILVGTGVACAHQKLRHRRGLFLGGGGNRSEWPHRHPHRLYGDGHRSRHRRRQPGRGLSGRRRRRSCARANRCFWSTRAGELRRSLHDRSEDAGRRGAQSALGPGHFLAHQRLDRRPCRHACSGRSRARDLPLRPVARRARFVAHRAEGSARGAMADGALEGRAIDHARAAAARAA